MRLESLIERGYIERSEEDKRIFKYVAWKGLLVIEIRYYALILTFIFQKGC